MIASADHPFLKAKAAESQGLLHFVDHMLQKLLPRFAHKPVAKHRKAKLLQQSTKSAIEFGHALKTEGRLMLPKQVTTALQAYNRFLALYEKAGGALLPKCHLMHHLIQNALAKGNAKYYSTYRDETFNGVVAKIARSCHRRTWYNAIHFKFQMVHRKNFEAVKKLWSKRAPQSA